MMHDNDEIFTFDLALNEDELFEDWKATHQSLAMPFKEGPMINPWEFWLVSRNVDNDFVREMQEKIELPFSPRFIFHKKYTILPMHKDLGTQCGINILINCKTPAPIEFASGNTYYYKTALLNTQKEHGVRNSSEDRLILKLSFKDTPYEIVKDRLRTLFT